MSKKLIFYFLIFNSLILSQSNVNPDISLIGTFNAFTNFNKDTPEYGKLNFDIPSFELYIDGYLNPYAKATANIAFEEGEFSAEEVYANIVRGLPLDIQLKAGKYLLGFGKLNMFHPHAWPFINRPLFHQVYFGEEGFNDIGVNFSFILPTEDFYTTLDLGVYKGDAITNNTGGEDADAFEVRGNSLIFVGRFGSFFSIGDFSNLDIGLSGSYGNYANSSFYIPDSIGFPSEMLTYLYGGMDFKFKYKPDSYTSLVIHWEGILNHRNVIRGTELKPSIESINTFGGFIYFDYQFLKQFSVGLKYDFTYGIIGDEPSFKTLATDDMTKTNGIEYWVGYYPVEETLALRLSAQNLFFGLADGFKKDTETTITLQMIFSLGPHKAHQF
ncbi:MAG: hypothetical protein WBQ32_08475 [Ignavibacteriaceae bacterium]